MVALKEQSYIWEQASILGFGVLRGHLPHLYVIRNVPQVLLYVSQDPRSLEIHIYYFKRF